MCENFLIQFSKEHHGFLISTQLLKKDVTNNTLHSNLAVNLSFIRDKFHSCLKSNYKKNEKLSDHPKSVDERFFHTTKLYEYDHKLIENLVLDLYDYL